MQKNRPLSGRSEKHDRVMRHIDDAAFGELTRKRSRLIEEKNEKGKKREMRQ